MVEHEVSVETTQVETETVTFCDYCGSPEDACESIRAVTVEDHPPRIVAYSPRMDKETILWEATDRDGKHLPPSRVGDLAPDNIGRLYLKHSTTTLAEACEQCRERLLAGEIPNPGTIHRDRTADDTSDESGGQPPSILRWAGGQAREHPIPIVYAGLLSLAIYTFASGMDTVFALLLLPLLALMAFMLLDADNGGYRP